MIISRAPVRITLGGGGTDLPSYYSQFGGFLVAAAINKYMYLSANRRFLPGIRLSYSKTEAVASVDDIQHRLFRECMKRCGVADRVELSSSADVPSNCGLGSSSAFAVSLLNVLHAFKREYVPLRDLAEEACDIEIDKLGEPIGKQDQYMAAFGGVTCLTFAQDGKVAVEPLGISEDSLGELERRIVLFYTGIERKASDILRNQDLQTRKAHTPTLDVLHQIREIGLQSRKTLEAGDLDAFGDLLDVHWQTKKRLSTAISDPFIDECYELARKNGALGGKIMGAGGGGFFMFYSNQNQDRLARALEGAGLAQLRFRFDFEGAKIVANMRFT